MHECSGKSELVSQVSSVPGREPEVSHLIWAEEAEQRGGGEEAEQRGGGGR